MGGRTFWTPTRRNPSETCRGLLFSNVCFLSCSFMSQFRLPENSASSSSSFATSPLPLFIGRMWTSPCLKFPPKAIRTRNKANYPFAPAFQSRRERIKKAGSSASRLLPKAGLSQIFVIALLFGWFFRPSCCLALLGTFFFSCIGQHIMRWRPFPYIINTALCFPWEVLSRLNFLLFPAVFFTQSFY